MERRAALDYRAMPESRQMKLPLAAGLWAFVCLVGAVAGTWRGYGGPAFAAALSAFGLLFAVQIGFAADGVVDYVAPLVYSVRGLLLFAPFLVYLGYALGARVFNWRSVALALAYAWVPCGLLLSAGDRAKGCWQDYVAALSIWLPVELHVLQTAFPYPDRVAHPLWGAYAISVGLIAFLLIRRIGGVGYKVAWGRGWGFIVLFNLAWFAVFAIVVGKAIGFIRFAPSMEHLKALPLTALGILIFNAWPEEFLFRGLMQNLLSTSLRSDVAGLLVAAVIFGAAHLNNGTQLPNWRYALLATFAGVAYGTAWMKTRCIFASALVHAGVNTLWFALFPTVAR